MILLRVHPLLGNVLVNRFREDIFLVNSPWLGHATINEDVFPMLSAKSSSGTTGYAIRF
jgi:hypothetical protein